MTFTRIVARRIADGISGNIYAGRVTVSGHRITAVEPGDFVPEKHDIFVDEDKILTPGFIDAHGHSDISLMAMPEAQGKFFQGIAYEISGNCGLSPFPLTELNREHLQELYRQYQISLSWNTLAEYQQQLALRQVALQLFPQVGHNTLRAAVAGYNTEKLSPNQLQAMCDLLDKELAAGAVGLSLGLLYTPGCFADINEVTALLKVTARHNKVCTVHLKSEGNQLEEFLQEMLAAAKRAGLKKLHLSHLKTAGKANFHKIDAILKALDDPELSVSGDIYCYNASMTQLSVILPAPFDSYDDVKNMQLLQDKNVFAKVLTQVKNERESSYWGHVQLISTQKPFDEYCGGFLSDIARKLGILPEELFLQIVRNDAVGSTAAFHTLSQENMERLAAHANVVPGSDESARNIESGTFGKSHPRGFGNHAEYFNLRKKQHTPIAQIIREMSGKTAEIFDLKNVGKIQIDSQAVFNLLDEQDYCSHAVFAAPHNTASGITPLKL